MYVYVNTGPRAGSSRHRRRDWRTGAACSGTRPGATAAIRDEIAPATAATAAAAAVVGNGGGELSQVAGRASRVIAIE